VRKRLGTRRCASRCGLVEAVRSERGAGRSAPDRQSPQRLSGLASDTPVTAVPLSGYRLVSELVIEPAGSSAARGAAGEW
jgi:hypothetical protein